MPTLMWDLEKGLEQRKGGRKDSRNKDTRAGSEANRHEGQLRAALVCHQLEWSIGAKSCSTVYFT